MQYYLSIFFFFLIFVSCTPQKPKKDNIHPSVTYVNVEKNSIVNATVKRTLSGKLISTLPLNDFYEFGGIHKYMALFNINTLQIDLYNHELKLIDTFGKQGNGPGEYNEISSVKTYNNHVGILDNLNRYLHFEIHNNKGVYKDLDVLLTDVFRAYDLTFNDDFLFISRLGIEQNNIIAKYDQNRNLVKEFGMVYQHPENLIKSPMNSSKIAVTDDYLIFSFENMPYILFYDIEKYELTKTIKISGFQKPQYPYNPANQSIWFQNTPGDNRIHNFFTSGRNLYISMSTYDQDFLVFKNLIINIDTNEIELINLPHYLWGVFQDNNLFVFYDIENNKLLGYEIF